MYQVICIGSALVDIFINSKNFISKPSTAGKLLCHIYGEKLEIDSLKVFSGGGGSNTAVGFARLGFKTGLISETGRDPFSTIVLQELQENEVDTSLVVREKREQTGGSVILVGEKGERTILVHRGASSMLDNYDIPTFWLSQTEWVHLSSIAGRLEALIKIFQLVRRDSTIGMSWNPGKEELKLLSHHKIPFTDIPVQIMILNRHEWQMIKSVQAPILAQIPRIIVTDGSNGGDVYVDGEFKTHYDATFVKAADSTGAGDAFATGFVAASILNKPLKECLDWAKRNATSVVSFYGAKSGLLRRDAISVSTN